MHYVLVVIITCIIWGYLGGLAAAVATGFYLFYVLLQYAIARLFTTTAKYYESLAASNMTIIALFIIFFLLGLFAGVSLSGYNFSQGLTQAELDKLALYVYVIYLAVMAVVTTFFVRLYFGVSFFVALMIAVITYVCWAVVCLGINMILPVSVVAS
ncbi:hypothetical protein [Saezia sanguinis]|uniref:hypothetical protein n=1 Tax=Saezia sanguinis TaxID=1965230 RepID=UPI00303EF701